MRRRDIVRGCGLAIAGIAGCEGPHQGELDPDVNVRGVSVEGFGDSWQAQVSIGVVAKPVHNLSVVAFDETGTAVCRARLGDIDPPGLPSDAVERTIFTCDSFPAIISATADESPCSGATFEILYWVGSDEQRGERLANGVIAWKRSERKCDEAFPPERVVEAVGVRSTETGDGRSEEP